LRANEILRPVDLPAQAGVEHFHHRLKERALVAAKNMRSPPQDCSLKADSSSSAAVLNSFPTPIGHVSRPLIGPLDAQHFRTDESLLDLQSALLIENIRHTLTIHAEMFRRILETTPSPSLLLAELLEDAGKRYIDFSELVSAAFRRAPIG
jgi:hypothetical protein